MLRWAHILIRGNNGFKERLSSRYVDKTDMIALVNRSISTNDKLICISRPRRFGKSYAAQMLCAYYGKGCDSHNLFAPYKIASDETYEKHINKYDVIYLDMSGIKPYTNNYESLVLFIIEKIKEDIKQAFLK